MLAYLLRLYKFIKMFKVIFHNFSKDDLKVSVGAHNSCKWDAKSTIFSVKNIFTHPNYNKETNFADIMLLKLIMRITFNKFVRPICLPKLGNFQNYIYILIYVNICNKSVTE
jgi:hypothetical protein